MVFFCAKIGFRFKQVVFTMALPFLSLIFMKVSLIAHQLHTDRRRHKGRLNQKDAGNGIFHPVKSFEDQFLIDDNTPYENSSI